MCEQCQLTELRLERQFQQNKLASLATLVETISHSLTRCRVVSFTNPLAAGSEAGNLSKCRATNYSKNQCTWRDDLIVFLGCGLRWLCQGVNSHQGSVLGFPCKRGGGAS